MSAQAGWYPDPGGGQDLYRYWDGRAWSAATSPNPAAAPPSQGLVGGGAPALPGQPQAGSGYGTSTYGGQSYGGQGSGGQSYGATGYGGGTGYGGQLHGSQPGQGAGSAADGSAYARFRQTQQRRSPVGWWLAGGALLVVIVVIAVLAVRGGSGGGGLTGVPGGQGSQNACPTPRSQSPAPNAAPNDGRVHGGPVSYPELSAPWMAPQDDQRVPFGSDVHVQQVSVESNYDRKGASWVASVLVAELQAGDGFFSPQQGSQVVVKCILGAFYGKNPVTSEVKVDRKATIDGHEAWLVESQLSFDIPGLTTKGELLIVAIVSAGASSGLYYASIPDTTPELVRPARQALAELKVDG